MIPVLKMIPILKMISVSFVELYTSLTLSSCDISICNWVCSSVAASVITSIVCMVVQKRRRSKELVTRITSPGLLDDDVTEISQKKEAFELASDTADTNAKN